MTSRTVQAVSLNGSTASGVILLVEDDPDHAFLVRRRLREQLLPDLDVQVLGTLAAATARLRVGDVRCVVLDLSLPDAKGLEAVQRLRAADPTIPIVVLTGMDSDELGRQALQLGAQDYLVKGQHGPEAVGRSVVFAFERAKRQAAEQSQAVFANRLQLVLEASAEGICMLDQDGRLSLVNRAAADLLGASPELLVGRLLHDFHRCPPACALEPQLRSAQRHELGEQQLSSLLGQVRVVEVRVAALGDPGIPGGSVVNLTDVTERRLAQDALAEREAQLVDAQRLAHLGSWEWDVTADEVQWSDEMHAVTGLLAVPPSAEAFELYADLVPAPDREELSLLFSGWTASREPVVLVHRLVRPDGQLRWLQCRASVSDATEGLRVVGTVQDITEQKVAEDALAHQALHDALTGLPNRALLLDRLDRALANTRRASVAVVFMDLDRFKWVNDSMSHAAGDQLLIAVAGRLRAVLRPTDTLARLGGDEFVLVCEQVTCEDQLFEIVDRLARQLEAPFAVEGQELPVTTSMGVALAGAGDSVDAESLIRDADTAMYRAKENGRARYEIFDEAMRDRATRRLEVQHDLRLALVNEEISAWYQPVLDLRSGRVIGCEALARWLHPQKGLLMPDLFIPYAEESGAIVALGEAVLVQACHQTAAWNRRRPADQPLTVAVNVSARQLSSPHLVQTVTSALRDSGLAPELLCLEVTESVVMEDVGVSGAVLGQLREAGIRTAVDDFGTGYSSLAYLLSLPVDVLKIDRSFVRVLDVADGPGVAIVRAIAALADALGLGVLAEGVETSAQLEQLQSLGVQHGQGFLWGEAVPPEEATWAELVPAPQVVIPAARQSEVPVR
ncbi:MAG: diguanylate cyclase/phosphodiesterase with and sensor(s) [Frankiales bacterium]|nr:diguanylate cyclase/phosphodiesterase with and sensor(s) [Frankiales bacterium]